MLCCFSSRSKVSGALTRASSIISEEKAELSNTRPQILAQKTAAEPLPDVVEELVPSATPGGSAPGRMVRYDEQMSR
jgi:hypothetical protein